MHLVAVYLLPWFMHWNVLADARVWPHYVLVAEWELPLPLKYYNSHNLLALLTSILVILLKFKQKKLSLKTNKNGHKTIQFLYICYRIESEYFPKLKCVFIEWDFYYHYMFVMMIRVWLLLLFLCLVVPKFLSRSANDSIVHASTWTFLAAVYFSHCRVFCCKTCLKLVKHQSEIEVQGLTVSAISLATDRSRERNERKTKRQTNTFEWQTTSLFNYWIIHYIYCLSMSKI